MCKFFSAISDGKGKVLFFKLTDIAKIEKKDNPESYNWNSHTSMAHYNGILGAEEDKWNKWEYDNEKKELKIDGKYNAKDDFKEVKKKIESYISKNNAMYLMKVFNWNSGDRNSGYRNSGDRNSGNRNSGNWNSGNMNTNEPQIRIFNKLTKVKDISFPDYFYFDLNEWISVSNMTEEEKGKFYWYKTTEGYLRTISYKEAWKLSFEKADKKDIAKTLKLPNFNYKIFEEITGITKKMINKRL